VYMGGWNWSVNPQEKQYFDEVYASSDQGKTWKLINGAAPWGRRNAFNAEVTKAGLIVLSSGISFTGKAENDVWVSPDGGYTWSRCVEDASFEDRYQQFTMLDEKENLVVGGGRFTNGAQNFNDVWRSSISFGSLDQVVRYCKMPKPTCSTSLGLGMACWPGSTTYVSTDGKSVTCPAVAACNNNVDPYEESSSTGVATETGAATSSNTSALTIVIVVFVLLFVLSSALAYYFYHKGAKRTVGDGNMALLHQPNTASEQYQGMTSQP